MHSAEKFAVIRSGGKQYKVTEGSIFDVEKLGLEPASSILLDDVLLAYINGVTYVGAPVLTNVKVHATIKENYRDKKITITKFKRRKHQLKRQGHRQTYTTLHIDSIIHSA